MFEIGTGILFAAGGVLMYLCFFTKDKNGVPRWRRSKIGPLMSLSAFTYKEPEEQKRLNTSKSKHIESPYD